MSEPWAFERFLADIRTRIQLIMERCDTTAADAQVCGLYDEDEESMRRAAKLGIRQARIVNIANHASCILAKIDEWLDEARHE